MKGSRWLFIACCLLLLTSCGQSEQIEETINWTPLQIAQTAHRYFNVTSEFMRSTRHYWDELVVPDASATDIAWSDNGPDHFPPAAVSKAEG